MKKIITIIILLLATVSSHAQYTAIPDYNFEQALIDYGIDNWSDGQVLTASISNVTDLYVNGYNIQSLEGIEDFTSLQYLYCSNNQLTSLNVSGLTNLIHIECSVNQLTSLNMTGLTNLEHLDCHDNQLTSLNLTGLTYLEYLQCAFNQISTLDVSALVNLEYFSFQGNQISSINLSGLNNLTVFNCGNNQLTSLNLTGLNSLQELYCNNNYLTTIDVSGLNNLRKLYCHRNLLTFLDASNLPNLRDLICEWNFITSINLTGLPNLQYLNCGTNLLPTLNVSGLNNLISLVCSFNQLSTLDLTSLSSIQYAHCQNNQLTSINVNGLTTMIQLNVRNNQLPTINVSSLTSLFTLWTNNNQLTTLNISGLTNLSYVVCINNQINNINLSGLTTLIELSCQNNQLTSLDLSGFVNLYNLRCNSNSALTCIQVNNVAAANANSSWIKDTSASYALTCGGTANPNITPIFTPIASICSGETLLPLPTTSTNGITGNWSPALNNLATTTYTFTPAVGQSATTTSLTITVNPSITPTFTTVAPICSGQFLNALPTTSTNGITGTWSPALNNLATTTYTFTPSAGQCANSTTMTIVVTPVTLPIFTPVAPICQGSTLTSLPTISTNGITGTWSPAVNNMATTVYIFTPTPGQCAKKVEMIIKVLPNHTPTFQNVPPICTGKILDPLPTTSTNGITGTWSPALNNTVTTTYTFTPTVGQCAVPVTMTIIVFQPTVAGAVTGGTTICRSSTSGVLTLSGHVGTIVRWESSTNNFATITVIPNTTTTYISGPITQTTQFRAVVQGVCGQSFSTSTTVIPVVVLTPAALRLTNNAISSLTAITNVSRYIGTNVPLTLTATLVAGATSYEWELPAGVNQLSGGTSNIITIDFAGVPNGVTSLYLGVKARNGDCVSSRNNSTLVPVTSSTGRLLRVGASIPASPSALKLTNDAISTTAGINNISRYIGTTTPLTLTANVSLNANSYDWELPAGVTQIAGGNSNIISVNFAGVPAGVTSLYLGVKARNGVGVSTRNNSALVPITTSTASLLKVTASVPSMVRAVAGQTAGICGGSTYQYTITPSVLATSYIITAPIGSIVTSASNPLNSTNILSTSDLTFSVLYPTNIAMITPKTLVITAVNGVGSNLTNRTINISTSMPSIGTPTGSEGITTFQRCNTQTFSVPAVNGATSYIWEVMNGAVIVGASNTNTVEIDFSLVPIFSTINIVKVKAVNACGVFSNVRNIRLSSIPCTGLRIATEETENLHNNNLLLDRINMYPNPTVGDFNLNFETSTDGEVDIEIYSSSAELVKISRGVKLERGMNKIEMDISKFANGVYFVRITNTVTAEIIVKKLVKK